jgi:putative ABC transport system substrate-binding protein
MVPGVTRIGVVRDPAITAGIGQFGAIQSVAPSFGVELTPINERDDAGEVERAIAAFARGSGGGLIVTGSGLTLLHRNLIIRLAAQYKLPAIYNARYFVADGGLMSYGADSLDGLRRAANYVDHILKGEKPTSQCSRRPSMN